MAEPVEGTRTTAAPVMRTVSVGRSPEDAFRIFTEEMGSWWPLRTHSRAADGGLRVEVERLVFEARAGGRVYEVRTDGSESPWAEVLVWEPPARFVMSWKPNDSPLPPTEVEVRFTAEGIGTRVDLEHRGWERLGSLAERARSEYAGDGGWVGVLGRFAAAAGPS